jgi:hypothetical protein
MIIGCIWIVWIQLQLKLPYNIFHCYYPFQVDCCIFCMHIIILLTPHLCTSPDYWLLHSNIILFHFHSRFIWEDWWLWSGWFGCCWVKKQTRNNECRSGQLKMSSNETYRPLAIPILPPLVIDRFEAIRRSDGVVGCWFGVGGGCLLERRRGKTFHQNINVKMMLVFKISPPFFIHHWPSMHARGRGGSGWVEVGCVASGGQCQEGEEG